MKKLLFTLAALCSFAVSAKAQHYNEILLFIEVGKTIDDVSDILYFHFDSDGKGYCTTMSKSTARDKYAKGILEEYGVNKQHNIKRDYSIDSSKYKVYCHKSSETDYTSLLCYDMWGQPMYGSKKYMYYYGIEYGDASLVKWNTSGDSDNVLNKKYYKRIYPSDLERKTPDFLN